MPHQTTSRSPSPCPPPDRGKLLRPLQALARPSGIWSLRSLRRRLLRDGDAPPTIDRFLGAALKAVGLDLRLSAMDLERVPATGTVMVCANHPTGALEGIVLLSVLRSVRQDVKVLADSQICEQLPELRDALLSVTDSANRQPDPRCARTALDWLRRGGCLVVFPAGTVGGPRGPFGRVQEAHWLASVAALQRLSGATVLPAWFGAPSPAVLRWLSLIGSRQRSRLLRSLIVGPRNTKVQLRFGHVVPPSQLDRFADDDERARYLRLRCEILGRRSDPDHESKPANAKPRRGLAPLAQPTPVAALEQDIATLPPESELLRHGRMQVLCAAADRLPNVLREIGRLRELTFRGVGEGSGQALDLDEYDGDYLHLFLWDGERKAIAGAYRIGDISRILVEKGPGGLYTSSLYRMDLRFFTRVQGGLELGRSFVQPVYQRAFLPLLLLWRGIATLVHRDPQRGLLFGTVSISADHHATSVRLMVDHLRSHCTNAELAGLVKPRRPWRRPRSERHGPTWQAESIAELRDVAAMVREIEVVRQGVPVLLEQYLKMGYDRCTRRRRSVQGAEAHARSLHGWQ